MKQGVIIAFCVAVILGWVSWVVLPEAWSGTDEVEATRRPVAKNAASVNADRAIARMRQLYEKPRALIDEFQSEDIAAWPPEVADKAGEAFHRRGRAYSILKDGKRAEADLKMAVERAPRNELFWVSLAENYNGNLKDEQQALAAYRRALELAGASTHWLPLSATLSAAAILRNQGRYDEALQMLRRYKDLGTISKGWRVAMLRAYGHIYAGQAKEQESLAKFHEALELESRK